MKGLAKAFAHFGAAGKNQRWSWSARSADGRTVVLAIWKESLDYTRKPIVCDTFGRPDLNLWRDRPGNRERLGNLIHARDNCGGRFRVVIVVAEDVNARPRKIARCIAKDKLIMQITEINEQTGEFRAQSVDG
jgi:hypothetical protein